MWRLSLKAKNVADDFPSLPERDAEHYETKVIFPLPGPISFSDDLPTLVTCGVAPLFYFFLFSAIQKNLAPLFYFVEPGFAAKKWGVFFFFLKFEKPGGTRAFNFKPLQDGMASPSSHPHTTCIVR